MRRAQQASERDREWLRVTIASIGDAVITTDNEGLVTLVGPQLSSIFRSSTVIVHFSSAYLAATAQPYRDFPFRNGNRSARPPLFGKSGKEHRMAIHDPRTARDFLNDARDRYDSSSPVLRWGGGIAVLVLVALLLFGASASTENGQSPAQTNSETPSDPSPPTTR